MIRTTRFSDLAEDIMRDPVRRAQIQAESLAMNDAVALGRLLAEVERDVSDPRTRLDPQPAVVLRVDHDEETYLSVLRGYVEELGGRLRLSAVFPDREVVIEPLPDCLMLPTPAGERETHVAAAADRSAATADIGN